jgi:uncharacterized integral membrane protein
MSEPERAKGSSRLSPKAIAAIVLVVVAVVFVVQNTKKTRVRFLLPEVEAPLWIALLAAVAVGVVAGWLIARRD